MTTQRDNPAPADPTPRRWVRQWAARQLPRLSRWRQRLAQWLDPGLPAWRIAAWAVIVAVLSMLTLHIVPVTAGTTAANWPAIAYLLGLVLLSASIALALLAAARLLFALPLFYRCCLVAGTGVLLPLFGYYATDRGAQVATGAVLLAASLLGAGLAGIVLWRRTRPSRVLRALTITATLAGAGFIAVAAWWLLDPGQTPEPRVFAQAGPGIARLDLPDPSRNGPLAFTTLTYGSGSDRHRREFGDDVDLVTASVDGSKLVSWEDRPAAIRARYWGFDTDELPLQGRVWLPAGDGPFPLVLIVHGNHLMEDFSDAGYAYLGEQLASRGYIAVSVDQNFINSGMADLRGTANENDARGWLLLEHLRLWHAWNASPGHRLSGKVDTGRIALIGHSRGGEAVAVAAAFNHLPRYPDDATVAFDYGYDIRAVVAISPVDGQYRPGRIGTPLRDVNYLTLQGGHDGDMTSFEGARQYDRVAFSDGFEGFKAAIHIADANHGQFNTDWGRFDITRPFAWLLDVAPLIPAHEQQRATQVYIGAFLEAALRDDARYLPLFGNHHAGAHWLPHNAYASEFAAAGQRTVAGFDEDLDLHTATLPGATISQRGLSDWREQRIPMRRGQRDTGAVFLGWTDADGAPAHYAITLPENAADGMASLTFALADTGSKPTRPDAGDDANGKQGGAPADEDAEQDDAAREPIDLSIRLTDAAGNAAVLPLSHQSALLPVERPNLFKSALVREPATAEPVFQTYTFTLEDFADAGPGFDPASIREIAFVFDRTAEGFVALNNVGFNPGPTPRNPAAAPDAR